MSIQQKKVEIEKLLDQMKEGFGEIGKEMKREYSGSYAELSIYKEQLNEVILS